MLKVRRRKGKTVQIAIEAPKDIDIVRDDAKNRTNNDTDKPAYPF